MLTMADDYPIHQTSDLIAFSGSDRNFFDRFFFNGYEPDGSVVFAVAFGVYPVVNIADAHFSVVLEGKQYCLHASRILDMERMKTEVGPIAINIVEPLQSLRVRVNGEGIAAELLFQGRAFPIAEPRFTERVGPRLVMDFTRMTQNGRWSGWVEVDGRRLELSAGALGTRDRSWGIRPIAGANAVPAVPASNPPAVIWRWTPTHFEDFSLYFHLIRDNTGSLYNTAAAIMPDGGRAEDVQHLEGATIDTPFQPGTRYSSSATIAIPHPGGEIKVSYEHIAHLQMRGIGYFSARWAHGGYKGPLAVEREDFVLADQNPLAPENCNMHVVSRAMMHQAGRADRHGVGIVDQLVVGPYTAFGFHGMGDGAP